MIQINISKDFSDSPGARYRSDGEKSGQEFYETLLKTKFDEALEKSEHLFIDLDNSWGYASSFISGSFGQLSSDYGADKVLRTLKFKSQDDPMLEQKIIEEIKNPNLK